LKALRKKEIDANPYVQFRKWFNGVLKLNMREPYAMILATATQNGIPSIRTVLLKQIEDDGFIFYTNYESQKGRELTDNPNAALLFYWDEVRRQVRISGKVKKVPVQKSEDYFQSRPRESQIGAWASRQSSIIPNRDYLEEQYEDMRKKFNKQVIPLPPYWGGFKIFPDKFEFWQGRESRLHDRISYLKKDKDKWEIVRLAP
jgi:pyridoxamine 5'-phosphate oxidase